MRPDRHWPRDDRYHDTEPADTRAELPYSGTLCNEHRLGDRITETKHFVSRYVIGPGLAGRAQSRRYGWELDLPAYWSTGCRNGRSARRCLAWRQARATCSGGGTSARPFRAGSIRFSWLVPGSPAGKPISACGAGPAPVCRGERNAPPAGTSSRRPGPRSSPSVNANTTPVASASPARSSRRAGPRLSASARLPTARGPLPELPGTAHQPYLEQPGQVSGLVLAAPADEAPAWSGARH